MKSRILVLVFLLLAIAVVAGGVGGCTAKQVDEWLKADVGSVTPTTQPATTSPAAPVPTNEQAVETAAAIAIQYGGQYGAAVGTTALGLLALWKITRRKPAPPATPIAAPPK